MKTAYIPMYRLVTQDDYTASDWFYSQAECNDYNKSMFSSFNIQTELIEHTVIDAIPYPSATIANQLMQLETMEIESDLYFFVTY